MLTAVTSASMAVEVIAVNISALADAFLNNVEQAIGDQLLAVGGRPGQGSVEVQRRKPVHGRPGGFVESVPATRGEYSGGDEIVDAAAEYVKRMTVRCDDRVGLLRPAGAKAVRNKPGSARAKSMYACPVARNRPMARRLRGPRLGTAAIDSIIASPNIVIA